MPRKKRPKTVAETVVPKAPTTWSLWLDDERSPALPGDHPDLVHAKNFEQAVAVIEAKGCLPTTMSLDYVLHQDCGYRNGQDFADWVAAEIRIGTYPVPEGFRVYAHSRNEEARVKMRATIRNAVLAALK